MEACSVCTCDDKDLPWYIKKDATADLDLPESTKIFSHDNVNPYGWVSSNNNYVNNLALSNIETLSTSDNSWIDTVEHHEKSPGVYVDLLQNPERFTGYSGESARKVWTAIQQENCFGGADDICNEKRVFFRLMSGLQSSISVHISKEYFYPNSGTWAPNIELFQKSVGMHKDRINNLYFAFLFLLRAIVKSKYVFESFDFDPTNSTESSVIKEFLSLLVSAKLDKRSYLQIIGTHINTKVATQQIDFLLNTTLDQCRKGFDESVLFQVNVNKYDDDKFWQSKTEKEIMKEEFRNRFKNVSRIMDCVTCEKCRLWGRFYNIFII